MTQSSQLTLMVLVDALRGDYVQHTRYLRGLAGQSATGWLRECFGFVPRAAYFGGLSAEQSGFTNMYCWDPDWSPFGAARHLPAGSAQTAQAWQLRSHLEKVAREQLSPFAKAYANSVSIPVGFLPFFDIVEKRAPWEKDVGYRSLFALLEEAGMPWYQCSWPLTNRQADPSDAGIVAQALQDLRPAHRFAYVHLQELDGVGHVHGPGSSELRKRLAATDQLCEKLIETLRARYAELDVVLFGDHGMVSVTGTVDVWSELEKTGLRFGIDYGYFLDSTMARFWFFHRDARSRVEEALSGLRGGRWLRQKELEAYGIAGCDRRNGEAFFLADPGVLIFPNFFQNSGKPIKGMHGYDPDCPDNLGYFLLHSTRRPEWARGRVGHVNPPELFGLSCQLIGLKGHASNGDTEPNTVRVLRPRADGRYTTHPDPEAEQVVAAHLQRIAEAISERCGPPEALVLMGSFGRGEGGVFKDAKGRFRPVNDYDVIVVSKKPLDGELRTLGAELARELEIDYVDLARSSGDNWDRLPLSMLHYDLKYGSRVLAGDPGLLERIPEYAPADLKGYEGLKLLLNRAAGLLTGLRGEFLGGAAPDAEQQRYLTNQVVKALIALGDSYLVRWGEYDASYRRRAERLKWLAPGAGFHPAVLAKVLAAYRFKLLPEYERFRPGLDEIAEFFPAYQQAIAELVQLHCGRASSGLSGALSAYVEYMSADAARTTEENAWCAKQAGIQPLLLPNPAPDISIRHLVYSVLPFLVLGAVDGDNADAARAEVRRRLRPVFVLPQREGSGHANWEELRRLVVQAWFAVCH